MSSTFNISMPRAMRQLLAPMAVLLLSAGAPQAAAVASVCTEAQALAPEPLYYLDGVRVDKTVIEQLDAKTIAYMNVLDEAKARQVFGENTGGVVVVVTKQNKKSAAVRALNARVDKAAPLVLGPKKPLK